LTSTLPGVTFSAWGKGGSIAAIEILLAVGPWIAAGEWLVRSAEFGHGRGSAELNAMSNQVNMVSTLTLVELLSDGVQMTEGRLEAYRAGDGGRYLVVESIRGDEWDIRASDPDLLESVRRTFEGVVDLPR